MNDTLLADSLEIAVLIRSTTLHQRPLEDVKKELDGIKTEIAQLIAEKGDVLMFGGKKGEAANIFNQLAHAVSLIAVVMPKGITIFHRTYCYPHPQLK